MTDSTPPVPTRFPGWQVAWAAFVVAVFGWGVGFYGPPIFLQAVQASRGWPVSLVSAAVTCHFLFGAVLVANLARLHRRFGLVAVTRAGAVATALGMFGWALAAEPWQLFAATLVSGAGWAATGAAAINAIVSPWFIRRRAAALSLAYNGASIGGVVFSPLWVALIAGLGFAGAAGLVGLAMVGTLWLLSGRYLSDGPAARGLHPDGDAAPAPAPPAAPRLRLWGDWRFRSLALASSLGLFAQIGLIAHLFSLLTPALGAAASGALAGLATAFAILGRSLLGWLLPADADRRLVAAGNYGLQAAGSLALLAAGGEAVPLLVLGVALFGLGLGNTTSLPPLIAQQDFAAAETGRVVALVTACSQACYAFAPLAFGALRDLLPPAPGLPGGHAPALFALAAAVQLAALLVLLFSRRAGASSLAISGPPSADRAAGRIPHSPASGRTPAPGS